MVEKHVWQNLSPRSYEEKRNFPRMKMDCAMSFGTADELATSEGYCKNLSAQGVLFSAPKPIQVGSLIEINITPQPAMVQPFNAVVEVLRVSNPDGMNHYEIAACIKQVK